MVQVGQGPVQMVGQERTTGAAGLPFRRQHEVIDHQLVAAVEQLGQGLAPGRGVEGVRLVDLDPGQGQAFGGVAVAQLGLFLFVDQQRLARFQPFLTRRDLMVRHRPSPCS